MVERKIPILDDHGSGVPSRLCATVCKIYSTEFDHVFPNSDIYSSVAGWCLVVVMSNSASRMAIFLTKWQAKEQLAGGCALSRFGGFSNQRCGCNFWPTKECLGKLVFLQLLTTKSHFFDTEWWRKIPNSPKWWVDFLIPGIHYLLHHLFKATLVGNGGEVDGNSRHNLFSRQEQLCDVWKILKRWKKHITPEHVDFCFPEVLEKKTKDFKNHPVGWIRPFWKKKTVELSLEDQPPFFIGWLPHHH